MSNIENTVNKKHIKKTIKIFVITIIFLTFFSNTINNFMLPQVETVYVTSGNLVKTVDGKGVIEAKQTYEFYIKSSIKVLEINAEAGQFIKKGQTIMILDKTELQKQLEDSLIILEQKKIQLEKLENTSSDIKQKYKINIENAEKETAKCQEDLDITKELYEEHIVTKEEMQQSEIKLETAKKNYSDLQLQKEIDIKNNELDIKNIKLDLQLKQNNINSLKEELKTIDKITAPTDGIIKEINFAKGSIANSSKPLFKMTDTTSGFKLKITVDKSKASYLAQGDKAVVNITSLGGVKLEGTITNITDNNENSEDKKDIYINLQSEDLKGGEQAKLHIQKETQRYDMLIPNEGIRKDNKGYYVLILKEKDGVFGKEYYVQKSMIYCDGFDNTNTAVTNGLFPLDKVVIKSSKPISSGCRVKLMNQ